MIETDSTWSCSVVCEQAGQTASQGLYRRVWQQHVWYEEEIVW